MATLYCDESGFSGPNLYRGAAIYFTYAGAAIEPDEASAALSEFRKRQGHTQGEVEFAAARKRDRGVAALDWILAEHGHRATVWCADKKYATAGKFFEYVFEPILTDHNALFYQHDFHRFIANLLFAGSRVRRYRGERTAGRFPADGLDARCFWVKEAAGRSGATKRASVHRHRCYRLRVPRSCAG